MDRGQIKANVHPAAMDIAEIAVLNTPPEIPLKDDFGEHRVQPDLISTVGCCCKPHQLLRPEVVEDLPVSIRGSVVCFVADDKPKVLRIKIIQPAYQRLNTGAHDLLTVTVLLGTFNAVRAVEVFARLLHQLLTVGQDQHPLTVPRDIRKGDGLPQPRCHLRKIRTRRLRFYRVNALGLIWP